jgi:predicted nucleic acid-binding protein
VIFLDTSAIYALADKADTNHMAAHNKFEEVLKSGETFLLHNYILLESAALLQARLGLPSALLFLKDAKSFEVEWVDSDLQEEAEKELELENRDQFSGLLSFIVMRRRNVKRLYFDPDFRNKGF